MMNHSLADQLRIIGTLLSRAAVSTEQANNAGQRLLVLVGDARELEHAATARMLDTQRLDWLADRNNHVGNVQLPMHCVTANLTSLRAAIDMAMREPFDTDEIDDDE